MIAWEHGVCLTSSRGQETPLEVLLVGTDVTGGKREGLFQVVEYLEEGHPRPSFWEVHVRTIECAARFDSGANAGKGGNPNPASKGCWRVPTRS